MNNFPAITPVSSAVAGAFAAAAQGSRAADALHREGFRRLQDGDPDEAYRLIRHALRENPADRQAQDNLARVLKALGREDEAVAIYRDLIALHSEWLPAQGNLAVSLLRRGEFAEGWRLNRARLQVVPGLRVITEPLSGRPLYEVQPPTVQQLRGKPVLIVSEQGIGDELFYLRWLPRLRAAGPDGIFWWPSERRGDTVNPPKLAPVLERSQELLSVVRDEAGLAALREAGALPVALADLPLVLGHVSVEDCPLPMPLEFRPQPWPVKRTRRAIGVTWQAGFASLRYKGGLYKAVPPRELGRALAAAALQADVVVIQRGLDLWDLAQFEGGLGRAVDEVVDGVEIPADEEMDWLAGMLASLDDYVAVSNTNVHMLAAMTGYRPRGHVLAPALPDFRWMNGPDKRGRSPWFPWTRCYRADVYGWEKPLAELSEAMQPR